MNTKKTIEIKDVRSFRRLEDPNGRNEKNKYVCYSHVQNIPHNIPMGTNPRDQKLTTNIAKGIKESLLSDDENFHLKNRGMVISAKDIHYDNKTNNLTMVFENEEEHGNIDGGHTYKLIQETIYNPEFHKDTKNKIQSSNQYVFLEILEDVEDMIEDLAEARNKSVQVDDKSLAELQNKFSSIKDAIGGMPFYERIAFRQNQQSSVGVRMIDAREVVAIISMFDTIKYSNKNHPKQAYSSKKVMLDRYLENPDHFEKFTNIATDIFDLYDLIETDFPHVYNEGGGRYGLAKFSGYKDDQIIKNSKFRQEPMKYVVPDGLIYPLVASFRGLVDFDENIQKFKWKLNPIDFYEKHKKDLVPKVMSFTRTVGNNPNAAGKDTTLWDILLMTVLLNTNN